MEIKSTSRIGSSSLRRVAKGTSGTTTDSFSVQASDTPQAHSLAAPGPLTALDSILALQNMDDATEGPSKGVAHGEALLQLLDDVRDGLLSGGIPRATLNKLASAVSRRHENFSDPKLQVVLDEIDLRARVELAKLEQIDQQSS